jgi:hypothetical protein
VPLVREPLPSDLFIGLASVIFSIVLAIDIESARTLRVRPLVPNRENSICFGNLKVTNPLAGRYERSKCHGTARAVRVSIAKCRANVGIHTRALSPINVKLTSMRDTRRRGRSR